MSDEALGLRERRKRRTRQEISHIATRLFLSRGFEAVTIADVAAAAGVAKMTVTNHFSRKEDLVLDIDAELVAGPARLLAGRAAGETPLSVLRDWHLAEVARHGAAVGFSEAPFAALVTGSPTLVARLREITDQREAALADALAADTRARRTDLTPRLAAAALSGTYRVLFGEVQRRVLAGEPHDRIARAARRDTRRAYRLLEPSLGDYAVRAG